jgi:hypothetical protein
MTVSTTPATPTPAPAEISANTPQENAPAEENLPADEGADLEPWRKVKHKFKAAGEVQEVEYDELIKRAEKAVGAEKRLAEAARKEKEIQQKLEKLQSVETFEDVVDLFGGDERARELAERYIWSKIEAEEAEAKLTPAEKKARDAEKRAADAEKKLKDVETEKSRHAQEAQQAAANELINKEVDDAIAEAEAAGLSPEDVPRYLEELFDEMITHLEYLEDCEEAGIAPNKSPLSPKDVLRKIQDKHTTRQTSWLKRLTAKDLKGLLSPEQLEELRIAEVSNLVQPSTQNRATKKKADNVDSVDPFARKADVKKKPNTKDWFSQMDKIYEKRG